MSEDTKINGTNKTIAGKNNNLKNNNLKHKTTESRKKKTLVEKGVTWVAYYQIFGSMIGAIIGLICIVIGVYIRLQPTVEVEVIGATITSVKWRDKDGCEPVVVHSGSGKNQRAETRWQCEIVAKYIVDGSINEYKFSNTGPQYYNGPLSLYRTGDTVTHVDPNAWKSSGWFLIGIGSFVLIFSLLWIWFCRVAPEACAALTIAQTLSGGRD